MPTRAELDQVKADLTQGMTDLANRVTASITALQSQLATGVAVTDQDLADLKAVATAMAAVDPADLGPPPPPSP